MSILRIFTVGLAAVVVAASIGCGGGYTREEAGNGREEAGPFVLGDLIEPFDAPALEELEAKVEWIDQPVLDSMELMRKKQAEEEPLVSVDEALQRKNDSKEDNQKILSALGRLPADDEQVDWEASMSRHIAADVKSTNPIMVSSTAEFDVNGLTSFGLFGFDWNFRPFAAKDTVVSWQTSQDRLYDKVVMRDDLTWSDGEPITAHDVVFSFQVIMSSQVPVPAVRSGTDEIRWVEAYDDQTLVFFHKKSLATNIWNVNFPVIPKHIYEESIAEDPTLQESDYHAKYERNPVTGGPYLMAERTIGQEIVLQRRESWYTHDGEQVRDKPHFKQVRFQVITEPSVALLALKGGDVEDKVLTAEEWATKTSGNDFYKNNTKVFGVEWTYFYFGWNNDTVFFSDKRVRQAMGHAFDHQEMHSKLLYGLYQPANGIFHPDSRWAPKDPPAPYTRNIKKAEQLLEEAGWIDHDGDGIRDKEMDGKLRRFEFSILVMNRPDRVAICELLKQNLSQIGIMCHIRPLEFTVLQEKSRNHEFQAMFAGWGTGTDPDTASNLWVTGEGRNYVNYSNEKVDQLFEQGRKELDPEKREKIYAQIHNLIYEDQPYTWLYYRNSFYGFNKQLRGYRFSPRGPYGYGPGFGSLWKPAAQ